jgi:hypothetical protein
MANRAFTAPKLRPHWVDLIGRFKLISDSYYDSNRGGGINGKEMAVAAMFTDGP